MQIFVFSLLFFLLTVLLGLVYFYLHAKPNYFKLVYYADVVGRGLLLGCALFHFLPDSMRALATYYQLPPYFLAILLSALMVAQLVLQKHYLVTTEGLSVRWFGWSEERLTYFIPIILMLMLSLHALTEGVALGAQTAMTSFSTLMFAILLHKGSESLALVTSMNTAPYKQSQRMSLLFLFALMTPIGLLLGQEMLISVLSNHLIVGLFNALAAMTFVYISQQCQAQCLFKSSTFKPQPKLEHACFYGSLGLMAILALWF